jgi:hypothetical protein
LLQPNDRDRAVDRSYLRPFGRVDHEGIEGIEVAYRDRPAVRRPGTVPAERDRCGPVRGIDPHLLRFSVGVEDLEDLAQDLGL